MQKSETLAKPPPFPVRDARVKNTKLYSFSPFLVFQVHKKKEARDEGDVWVKKNL